MQSSKYWIEHLEMQKHPEGGWFKEVYRSAESISKTALPPRFSGNRSLGTSIYFLLKEDEYSAFHKIKSDEIWHFYAGNPLNIYQITKSGELKTHLLGNNPDQEESLQIVIEKETWFSSKIAKNKVGNYALVGCTVAPGFDFKDFKMANKNHLAKEFPEHQAVINELCI